jgi:endonuclease YncB( thermonuclease family)
LSYRYLVACVVLISLSVSGGLALWTVWEDLASTASAVQAQPAGADTQEATVTRVVDGDTIEVSPAVEGTADVRLIGVDTPETVDPNEPVQPCGPEASAFTTQQLQRQSVTLEFDEDRMDDLDRALAYVWVPDLDGELFNETLVREGYAKVTIFQPNDKYENRLLTAQEQAKDENLRLWSPNPCEDQATTPEPTTPEPTTPEATTEATTPATTPAPAPSPPPERLNRPERPRERGSLMNAGGPSEGPVPVMTDGECPKEYPDEHSGACYAQ